MTDGGGMIERVARAIFETPGPDGDWLCEYIGDNFRIDDATQTAAERTAAIMAICRAAARAAIEAMRNTTGPVLRAGHTPLCPLFREEAEAYGMAERVWQRMITAALKEQE